MIALTIDIEWSPDPIVDACVRLLEDAKVAATLFCTDPDTDRSGASSSLRGRYSSRIELALHPNFDQTTDYGSVFDRMLVHYPGVTGYRSHNTLSGWRIWTAAVERGFRYESNMLLYGLSVPPMPVNDATLDLWSYPVYFMDSPVLAREGFDWTLPRATVEALARDTSTVAVFDFHPISLYYDCRTAADYAATKAYYHRPRPDLSFEKKARPEGAMKLFGSLLREISPSSFVSLGEHEARRRAAR